MSDSNKQRRLFDLDVRKVSFVSNPANGYDFLFFKSEGSQDMSEFQEAIKEKSEELQKSDNIEEQADESLQTLSKYYGDLPTEARESLAVIASLINKSFEDEEETMEEDELEDKVAEIVKETLDEEGVLKQSDSDMIQEAVGKLADVLDMPVSDIHDVLGPLYDESEYGYPEKEEEPEETKTELEVSEMSEEQVNKVKDEFGLYSEEEVEDVVEEEVDNLFEGETE